MLAKKISKKISAFFLLRQRSGITRLNTFFFMARPVLVKQRSLTWSPPK